MRAHDDAEAAAEAKSARVLRLGIAGFSGVLLLTIVASIHLSTLDVAFGSMLSGATRIWRGQSASFRVAAFDPRGVDWVGPIAATFTLRDAAGVHAEATDAGHAFAEARLAVPSEVAAEASLVVEVETPLGSDRITVALEARDRPGPLAGRIAPHTDAYPEGQRPSGAYQVAVYPRGGHVVAGLENMISARISREDQPVATSLHTDAFGIHSESDEAGIFHFPFSPLPRAQHLSFSVGDGGAETITIPLEVKSSGLLLEVSPRGLVAPGADLSVRLATLPFADPTVHLDVWVGGALVLTTSRPVADRHLELEIGLPRAARGLVRVEAYRNLGADDDVRSTQLLWASEAPPEQAAATALDALAELDGGDPILALARAASGAAKVELTRMALTRYLPDSAGPPTIASTLDARRTLVADRRRSARTAVHTLFVFTLVVGLGLILGWVVRHTIRVRRSMRAVMDQGAAAGEVIDREGIERLARFSHLYDLFLALLTIALIGYGILTLLLRMKWEW